MIQLVLPLCWADSLQGPAMGGGPVRALIALSVGPGARRAALPSQPLSRLCLFMYLNTIFIFKEITKSLPSTGYGTEIT